MCGMTCQPARSQNRCPAGHGIGCDSHDRGRPWAVWRQAAGMCGRGAAGRDGAPADAVCPSAGEGPQPGDPVWPFPGQPGGDDAGNADDGRAPDRPARGRAARVGDPGHHRAAFPDPRGQQARLRQGREWRGSRPVPASGAGGGRGRRRDHWTGGLRRSEPHQRQGGGPQAAGGGGEEVAPLAVWRRGGRRTAGERGADHRGGGPGERYLRLVRPSAGVGTSAVPFGAGSRPGGRRAAVGALRRMGGAGPYHDQRATARPTGGTAGHRGAAVWHGDAATPEDAGGPGSRQGIAGERGAVDGGCAGDRSARGPGTRALAIADHTCRHLGGRGTPDRHLVPAALDHRTGLPFAEGAWPAHRGLADGGSPQLHQARRGGADRGGALDAACIGPRRRHRTEDHRRRQSNRHAGPAQPEYHPGRAHRGAEEPARPRLPGLVRLDRCQARRLVRLYLQRLQAARTQDHASRPAPSGPDPGRMAAGYSFRRCVTPVALKGRGLGGGVRRPYRTETSQREPLPLHHCLRHQLARQVVRTAPQTDTEMIDHRRQALRHLARSRIRRRQPRRRLPRPRRNAQASPTPAARGPAARTARPP